MPGIDINWMAVIVAVIISMVVGAVWYSPALFAKQWASLVGRKMDDVQKNAGQSYAILAAGALVQAWILSYFIQYAQANTAYKGVVVGFWLWVGFVAITQGLNTVFAGSRKKLWAINTGYFLVVLLINGALLAVWH